MARINIEEKYWSDPRRAKLTRLLNGDSRTADGLIIQSWRLAQEHCAGDFMIPLSQFLCIENAENLFYCDLADLIQANRKQTQANLKQTLADAYQTQATSETCFVYVRGSREMFSWLIKRRAAGRVGGGKKAKKTESPTQDLNQDEANRKQTQANLSKRKQTDPSSSSSSSIKKNTYGLSDEPLLEELYQNYPKRDGNQRKAPGMKVLSGILQKRGPDDIRKAIENYCDYCRRKGLIGTEHVMQFKTFVSQAWEEWIAPNGKASSQFIFTDLQGNRIYE